jgi:hypothetical protein
VILDVIPRRARLAVLCAAMLVACAGPEAATTEAPNGGHASSAGASHAANGPAVRAKHSPSTSEEDGYTVPDRLRRPLRRVQMPTGCCEVTKPVRRVNPIWGPVQGRGPVYPTSERGTLHMEFPPDPRWIFGGTGYGVAKVIWIAKPSYDGPVLIRGFQIGGPHRVRFTVGHSVTGEPLSEDQFLTETAAPPNTARYGPVVRGWRELKTLRITAVPVPGCYAWQVDGLDFSYTIVFKVVDSSA